jgi:hypothetical protein
MRHDFVADNKIHGVNYVPIQFDDVSWAKLKDFAQRHLAATKPERSLKFHIKQQINAIAERYGMSSLVRCGRAGWSPNWLACRSTHLIPHEDAPCSGGGPQLKRVRGLSFNCLLVELRNSTPLSRFCQQFARGGIRHLTQQFTPTLSLIGSVSQEG